MTELEQTLRALAAEIEWPATPELTPRFEPVRRRRRSLLLAVAAALLAIAVAFAVPQARSSILRFFHLGGVTIERVGTLPAAEQRPLAADLGQPVTRAEAESALGTPFLLPATSGEPALYDRLGVVSTLLATPQPVLLSESRFTGLMKKLVGTATGVESVSIDAGSGRRLDRRRPARLLRSRAAAAARGQRAPLGERTGSPSGSRDGR